LKQYMIKLINYRSTNALVNTSRVFEFFEIPRYKCDGLIGLKTMWKHIRFQYSITKGSPNFPRLIFSPGLLFTGIALSAIGFDLTKPRE